MPACDIAEIKCVSLLGGSTVHGWQKSLPRSFCHVTYCCNMPDRDVPEDELTIADLFPSLPPAEQEAVRETLDAYCELLFQIFQRWQRESRAGFDDPNLNP